MKLKHIAEMTFVVSHESKKRAWEEVQEKTTELASLAANIMYLQARDDWEDISEEKKASFGDNFDSWFRNSYVHVTVGSTSDQLRNIIERKLTALFSKK